MKRAFGLVLAVACHGDPANVPDATIPDASMSDAAPTGTYGAVSGSRLKITWLEVDGGARVFEELFDVERGEACRIVPGAGDAIYCAPRGQAQIAYSDASCTQPMMRAPAASDCGAQARYAHEYASHASDPCGPLALTQLRTVGPPITRVDRTWTLVDGQCSGGREEPPGFDYFALGEEVSLDQLAQLTLAQPVGPGAARLQRRSYESSDGLHLPLVAHDSVLDTTCDPQSDLGSSTQCLPDARLADVGSISSDVSCSSRLATVREDCPAPAYAIDHEPDACPGEAPTYFAIVAPAPRTPLYASDGASCAATAADSRSDYYEISPAPLAVMQLERVLEGPGARVRNISFAASGGGSWHDRDRLFDTSLDTTCLMRAQPDGTLLCLPTADTAGVYSLFLDASCTLPIDVAFVPAESASCDAPIPRFGSHIVSDRQCSPTDTTHLLEGELLEPVWQRYDNRCDQLQLPGRMFRVGPALTSTSLATARVVIDP